MSSTVNKTKGTTVTFLLMRYDVFVLDEALRQQWVVLGQ